MTGTGESDSVFKRYSKMFVSFTQGKNFLRKCIKPSRNEFKDMLRAHLAGIFFLGAMGYLVKLIHIPINNLIVSNAGIAS